MFWIGATVGFIAGISATLVIALAGSNGRDDDWDDEP